jgi:DNA-directed RNA polymerase specialized sigma24 family protein
MVVAVADVGGETAVKLGEDLGRRLRASCQRTGRSPQDLIREAVERIVQEDDGYRPPSWVGAWASTDGAAP